MFAKSFKVLQIWLKFGFEFKFKFEMNFKLKFNFARKIL